MRSVSEDGGWGWGWGTWVMLREVWGVSAMEVWGASAMKREVWEAGDIAREGFKIKVIAIFLICHLNIQSAEI